jgi:hypothetical protein
MIEGIMKPFWYIQIRNDRDSVAQRLAYAVQEYGCEVRIERYIPFNDDLDLTNLPSDRPVVFQGAISCARSVQNRNLPLFPFAWFDFDQFTSHSYYGRWGKWLINQKYLMMPMGDLPRNKDFIYSVFNTDAVFIRPDSNDKIFTGQVVEKDSFDGWMNWAYAEGEIPDALAVIAPPVEIEAEWRLVVRNGRVVTGSRYKVFDQLDVEAGYPDEAAEVAEEACQKWTPHPVLVVDVGKTKNGYGIVECGSINCAGFYDCELAAIVAAMSEQAADDFEKRQSQEETG